MDQDRLDECYHPNMVKLRKLTEELTSFEHEIDKKTCIWQRQGCAGGHEEFGSNRFNCIMYNLFSDDGASFTRNFAPRGSEIEFSARTLREIIGVYKGQLTIYLNDGVGAVVSQYEIIEIPPNTSYKGIFNEDSNYWVIITSSIKENFDAAA